MHIETCAVCSFYDNNETYFFLEAEGLADVYYCTRIHNHPS